MLISTPQHSWVKDVAVEVTPEHSREHTGHGHPVSQDTNNATAAQPAIKIRNKTVSTKTGRKMLEEPPRGTETKLGIPEKSHISSWLFDVAGYRWKLQITPDELEHNRKESNHSMGTTAWRWREINPYES